jgi:hypothetical protein
MERPLRAFVDTLCKNCNLVAKNGFAPKSSKNIECIKELLVSE